MRKAARFFSGLFYRGGKAFKISLPLAAFLGSLALAVSVPLTGIASEPAGGNCSTGTFRINTSATYGGKALDLLLEVTAEENGQPLDQNGNPIDCVQVDNGILELALKDDDSQDTDAWMELRAQLVEAGTNNPVVVDRALFSAFDLDSYSDNNVDTDSDDVYLYNPASSAVYLTSDSDVTYHDVALSSAGTAGLVYNTWLEGKNNGNCSDSASSTDATCRAGAIFTGASEFYFRVQNDDAYGDSGEGYHRLFLISLQISHLSPVVTGSDYGDAPSSYGSAGLGRTTERSLGRGLIADQEDSQQASTGADADDTVSSNYPAQYFDDEEAVTLGGSDFQGQVLQTGQSYDLQVDTYTESGEAGYLSAWVDFNRDGDFGDAGEQILANQSVADGQQTTTITLAVPDTASTGDTYARFIYSENQVTDATGANGGNGEVEDYKITLLERGISGRVLEDVNGDSQVDDAQPVAGATVKLYDASGSLLQTTSTDASGSYAFGVDGDGTYYVVVDSKTVSPSAGFNNNQGQTDVWAEQTYGAGGSWGGALCDSDADESTDPAALSSNGACFGGRNGGTSDDASALTTAEHVARVTVAGDGVTGVDFGFSFNVVTNTNDQATERPLPALQ